MRNHPVSRRHSKWGFFRDGWRSSQVPRIPSPIALEYFHPNRHHATPKGHPAPGTRPCAQGEGDLPRGRKFPVCFEGKIPVMVK